MCGGCVVLDSRRQLRVQQDDGRFCTWWCTEIPLIARSWLRNMCLNTLVTKLLRTWLAITSTVLTEDVCVQPPVYELS